MHLGRTVEARVHESVEVLRSSQCKIQIIHPNVTFARASVVCFDSLLIHKTERRNSMLDCLAFKTVFLLICLLRKHALSSPEMGGVLVAQALLH